MSEQNNKCLIAGCTNEPTKDPNGNKSPAAWCTSCYAKAYDIYILGKKQAADDKLNYVPSLVIR